MLVSLLGCGGRAVEPIYTAPGSAVAPEAAPVVSEQEAPRRSCLATAEPSQHALARVTHTVEVGERSFALGWRSSGSTVEAVIVSLGPQGALAVTPVPVPPADPSALGGDAGGLIVVSVATRGTGMLLRVALGSDGALTAGTPTSLPEVAWGWPAEIRSDGVHATLEHALATTEQGIGSIVQYTIDLATQRVIATRPAPAKDAEDPASATLGGSVPLPTPDLPRFIRVAHPDGVIEVGWSGGAGMMHSPTDARGIRRYFKHWHFDGGQVRLLRHEKDRWRAIDALPLALAQAEGTFHDGYTPVVLRHGLHAAVLLAPAGVGDAAWFQPYRVPCASP